jgi:hypothetical protein
MGAHMPHTERLAKENANKHTAVLTAAGYTDEILSWHRDRGLCFCTDFHGSCKGNFHEEIGDADWTNAGCMKRRSNRKTRWTFVCMVTKDEMNALLPVHGTLLGAMEMILQARQRVTRRSEIERRDMSWKVTGIMW